MNLRNKIISMPDWSKRYILGRKPTDDPNRGICLINTWVENNEHPPKDHEYSLWNVEEQDEGKSFAMWPYEGADSNALIIEMLEDFVENAFQE